MSRIRIMLVVGVALLVVQTPGCQQTANTNNTNAAINANTK